MESANKGKRYPAEILTDAEVHGLIKACSRRAPTGVRNRALIVMLYRGGLRLSEALALMPKDLDEEAGTVRILNGKGAKARTIGLDPAAFVFIQRWLDVRHKRGINGKARLFCTLRGQTLDSSYVRHLFRRLGEKVGIEKRVHPHGLRHTHAAQLAMEGCPLNLIQQQLGHSSLATTSRYLEHIAPQQLIETMRHRPWNSAHSLFYKLIHERAQTLSRAGKPTSPKKQGEPMASVL